MIGATTSKVLDLTLLNKGDMVYGTSTIKVEIGLKIGSKIEYVPMGIYNIDDIEKNDYTIKITAFDNMIKFEKNFTTNLGDTLTLQQIVNELVRITGVQFTGTLPAYSVKKLEGFSCREVLGYVASICGGNAVITRDGKFTIVTPKDVNYAIGTANYFIGDYKREETKYKIGKISCQVGEKVLSKGSLGADSMELEFENPWVNDSILQDIYNKLNRFEYLGYSMKWQGDLSLDVGDIVTITDKKGVVRKHPILSQKFTYTGGLTSEIGAKGETKNKNSFSSSGSAAKKVERVVMELALINKALIDVAYIGDLTAGNIKFDTASGGTLDLQTLLAKFVSGENGQFLNLTTDNVTISNAVIKDIIAKNISVEDLKAGKISTNKFTVASDDGGITIVGPTMQFKDKSNKVRLQLGQDTQGNFNFILRGADGTTTLIDHTGIKEKAIADNLIKEKMIAVDAIGEKQINYSSLITGLNKDTNTSLIKASKVAIDLTGQSLEVSFNSLKTNVDSKENRNLALETATPCEADNSLLNGGVNRTRLLYKTYTNRLKVGDKVTVSFDFEYTNLKMADGKTINDVRLSVQGAGNVTEWGSGGFPAYSFREKITYGSTEKKKIHITYSAKIYNEQLKNQYWIPNIRTDYIIGGSYKVSNFKFEVGNETGWTPAPEDTSKIGEKIESNTTSIKAVQGNIETLIKDTTIEKDGVTTKLKDAYSALNQTVNGMSSTVASHTTKWDDNEKTISSLQTQISQNATDIKSKVESTYVTQVFEKTIKSVDVMYYLSTSSSGLIGGSWVTTAPKWQQGKYIWTKTITIYMNNSTQETTPVCISGVNGQNGTNGKGIKSIVEQYYLSTSTTTQTGGSWVTTPPTWTNGKYMWTRSVITYTDNSTTTTNPVCVSGSKGDTGAKGDKGATGVGISSVDVEYYLSTSSTILAGGSWVTTAPTWVNGKYMWSRTKTVTTAGATTYSNPVCITGAKGSTGASGSSFLTFTTNYQYNQENINSYSRNGYVGTWNVNEATTGCKVGDTVNLRVYNTSKKCNSFIIAKVNSISATAINTTSLGLSENGATGATGSTGQGVASITEEYYLSTSKTTQTGGSWVTTPPTWVNGKYMWTRSKIVYKNPTATAYTTPLCDSSWEAVNEVQVGGRNLAQLTSNAYSEAYTNFSGVANTCPPLGKVLTDGLKVGDIVTVRVIYKYTNIVAASGQTAKCWIQGSGNITSWSTGSFAGSSAKTISGSGELEFLYSFKITSDHLKNTFWNTNIRHDYVKSGSVQWKLYKVEKGNKATDWTPAPEDVDSAISAVDSKVTTTITKVSSIETNLSSITQRVSSTESTVSSINGTVTSLSNRVNSAESKLTATSLTTTISSAINAGTNSITTTQFVMDKTGLTIKNGAIKIQNKAGTNVFASDTNGNLTITGTFINKNSNGVKAIEINNTNIYFYDWERNGRELGVIYSSYLTNYPNCRGFSIAHNSQGYLTFGYRKPDSNFGTYIILDKYSKNPNYAAPIRFLESAVFSQAVNMQNRVYVPNTIVFDDVYRSTSAKMFKAPTANRLVLEVSVNAVGDGLRIQSNTGSLLAQIRAGEHYPIHLNNNTYMSGDLAVSGSKNSLQATKSYGERLINAIESAEYYYSDFGFGEINNDGECYISIDDILQECVNLDCEYHIFTQKYNGDITSIDRHRDYFIVHGEPETKFSWQYIAKRKGYENVRLDVPDIGTVEDISVFTEEDLEVKTVEDTLLDVLTFRLEDILMEE